jgi:hypothetical protein
MEKAQQALQVYKQQSTSLNTNGMVTPGNGSVFTMPVKNSKMEVVVAEE